MSKESRLADANNNFLIGFSFEMVQVLSIAKLEKEEIEKLFHKIILQRPYFSGYCLLLSTLSALFRTSAGQRF